MRTHYPVVVGVLTATLVFGVAAPADAQTRAYRTPWGDPDLQGIWSNQTLTPLERPAEFAAKTHLTEAEAAQYQARLRQQQNADNRQPGTLRDVNTAYNDFWWDRGDRIVPDRRTSLIIDPPDGRVPEMTAAGKARVAAEAEANRRESEFPAGPGDFDVYSRCIIRGALPRLSTGYNNNYQIVQAPGYVAILQEQVHETRIIPLDGRPHIPGAVRQWLGDSRGRWDGDTLIVETTHFTDAARGSTFRGATKNMHLVERFRRIDETTIDYEFTVTDPETWVRPWTVNVPWFRPDGMLYEYACHEGNYGLANTLTAARKLERDAQQGAPPQK